VLVLGVAYKPDIDDVRESPALDVIALLQKKGALVEYHDPYISNIHHEHEHWKLSSLPDDKMMDAVCKADVVVLVTNHKVYNYPDLINNASFLFDTRNATGPYVNDSTTNVVRL
jgi:UDP-N-acetyl-D-glucosamine dehydrogenase